MREEPSAEARKIARTMRDNFVALIQEGFTPREALELIGAMMAAAAMMPPEEG